MTRNSGVDMKQLERRLERLDREIRRMNEGIDRILSRGQHDELSQSMVSPADETMRSVRGADGEERQVHVLCGHGELAEREGRDGVDLDEKGDRPQAGGEAGCQVIDGNIIV